jgi:hypothetical protein
MMTSWLDLHPLLFLTRTIFQEYARDNPCIQNRKINGATHVLLEFARKWIYFDLYSHPVC